MKNYTSVSILPFLSKIIEKDVFKYISDFLFQNHLLDPKQSGFKRGHSTETALLSVTEALGVAKASAQSSILILQDLSAALNTVNHDILLSALSKLGIRGQSTQLVLIVSQWTFIQCVLAGTSVKISPPLHYFTPGFGTWTPPVFYLHHVLRWDHPFLCVLLSLLMRLILNCTFENWAPGLPSQSGYPTKYEHPTWFIFIGHNLFDRPKRTHVTPLPVTLHWLPVAARIKLKSLTLA